ncbi:MAG: flippase [bacterium]
MKPSRVTSNSILILTSDVIDRILRFVLVIVAARLLGDSDYGKFGFAISFGMLFLIFADFGMHQLLIREIARKPDDVERLMGNGLIVKLLLSGFTALCIFTAAQLTNKPQDVLYAVYILGGALIVESMAEYFSTVFQGMQVMKYTAIANLILSISNTLIGVVVLVTGGSFVMLAWVYLFSRFLKLVYCYFITKVKFAPVALIFEKSLLKVLMLEGATFGILRFFSIMYSNVDSTMLSFMSGDQVVGWYTVALRLKLAMMALPLGIMRAVYPALSAYYKSNEEAFRNLFSKTFKLLFWTGTSIAIVLSLLSEKIIVVIFGEQFINGAGALKFLAWSTAVYFIGTTMTHVTRSVGKQVFTAKVVAASAVLNLILNFVLIPKYSLLGAAFATLMAEMFTFGFHLRYVGRYIVNTPFWRLLPKMALINVVTGVAVLLTIDFSLLMNFGIALTVNISLVFILRYYSITEFSGIISLFKNGRRTKY